MIVVENLNKSFSEKALFKNWNLKVKDGEFVVIAGKSGCGKTTLLNMLGGIENVDSGSIIVDGMDITNKKNLKEYFLFKIGFLFQNFALVENKTVKENIEFVQKISRTGKTIREVLSMVNLEEKENEKVYKLSGGEQQRVALARLIYKKCNIILADEPTGSLDLDNAKRVLDILHQLNQQGKTIILVTHDERIIANERRIITL